jgi:hypothetical protein
MSDNTVINPNTSYMPIPCTSYTLHTPMIIFIIMCFFCVISMIIYKSSFSNIPSMCTIGGQSFMMFSSSIILLFIGAISIYVEWCVMTLFVLFVTLCIFGITSPEIFFSS